MIYLIGNKDSGPIKIGYTGNKTAKNRLSGIQNGNPNRLHILFTKLGDMADERSIHKLLSSHRKVGEWFDREAVLEWANNEKDIIWVDAMPQASNVTEHKVTKVMKNYCVGNKSIRIGGLRKQFRLLNTQNFLTINGWKLMKRTHTEENRKLADRFRLSMFPSSLKGKLEWLPSI
tara:strand:- start:591 stop:1115 length:525 start_codon:yes stop_codon:yes gene_type:complete